jgi:nitric oxide reductase subunit B
VTVISFAILGYWGLDLYRQAPPVPGKVVRADGVVLFTGEDIKDGQNVWQSMGGQEVGSIWGHGAYVAPDWSADWLHREAVWLLDRWADQAQGKPYAQLGAEQQAGLKARLKGELRRNTYDRATGALTVSADRAEAIAAVGTHYASLFGHDPELDKLRKAYAIPANSIKDPERQRKMNAFFFWAAWTCATERPGSAVTYTNNWPAEELIDNKPSSGIVVWSLVSIVLLLAGVGAMAWYMAIQRH